MSVADEQLKRIQDKVQLLVKQCQQLQKENLLLKGELLQSRDETSSQQKNIDTLKQQVNVLRLNTGDMTETDKKDFEKKINVYLKEIDRCIAMLGE